VAIAYALGKFYQKEAVYIRICECFLMNEKRIESLKTFSLLLLFILLCKKPQSRV